MRIVLVISLILFLNDLRSICESNHSVNDGLPNRMQDDLQDRIKTFRVSRDADSASSLDADPASFSHVVLPVEVDLTKWTQALENRLEEFSKSVNDTLQAIESQIEGLTSKFDALDNRFTISKLNNKKRFDHIQIRFDQFERRLNDSRIKEETMMDELEERINQQCACSTSSSGLQDKIGTNSPSALSTAVPSPPEETRTPNGPVTGNPTIVSQRETQTTIWNTVPTTVPGDVTKDITECLEPKTQCTGEDCKFTPTCNGAGCECRIDAHCSHTSYQLTCKDNICTCTKSFCPCKKNEDCSCPLQCKDFQGEMRCLSAAFGNLGKIVALFKRRQHLGAP